MRRIRSLALAIVLVASADLFAAQQTINVASLAGRVTDPSGAVVPGASVTARHIETNLDSETVTDQEGRFRFPYLVVGRYEVTIRRGRVHVVRPTLVAGTTPGTQATLALFHAVTADGRRFSPRQRIPVQGFPRHPQIAIGTDGTVVAAWDEQATRGGRRVALGRGIPDERGAIRVSRRAVDDTGSAAYPAVTATDDGIVLVWTSGTTGQTTLRVERIANWN